MQEPHLHPWLEPEMKTPAHPFLTCTLAALLPMLLASCGGLRVGSSDDPVHRARELAAAGDTLNAVRLLERVDVEKTRDPGLFVVLGRYFRDGGTIENRLRSQRLLERAVQLFPDDPLLKLELGKTYFAQTFYLDAIRMVTEALKMDSTLCEAYFYIGLYHYRNWKRVNEFVDDLKAARRHFRELISCDPTNVPGTVKYLFCLYALDDKVTAAGACETAISHLGAIPEFYLLRAALAYDEERLDDAQRDFSHGLSLLDENVRREYSDIVMLLPYGQRAPYSAATDAKREIAERTYWMEMDPDPTTQLNERQLEHTYRMFLADLYFSLPNPAIRGWDTERGATFVKFGWPTEITSTLGDSWNSGRVESWFFKRSGRVREFVFVDEFLNGNLRIPILADSMLTALRYEPSVSGYEPDALSIPGEMSVTTFKDDDMTSSFYLTLKIDADSLRNAANLEEINHFFFRGSFFDGGWVAETRFADTLWTSEVKIARYAGREFYHLTRDVVMPFDFYHVACSFQDEFGLVTSLFKTFGDTYRYAGDQLAVSDILLEDAARPEAVRFERGGKELFPNPGRTYREGQLLLVYFEVYNLQAVRGNNEYDVSFFIFESPEEETSRWRRLGSRIASITGLGAEAEPSIAQTVRRTGEGFKTQEEIAINVDNLASGRYELVISIDDKTSGEKAQSSTVFFKAGG